MTAPSEGDLLAIADRILAQAQPGEDVEVVVGRGRHTEVRAYEGEVESLTSAESQGVGVRVVLGDRQGVASAGSLDPDVIDEVLADARDNATFATPDEWVALAVPDGVPLVEMDLFRPSLLEVPTERKVALALELERATRAADPRITGVESADVVDSMGEGCVVSTTGIRSYRRSTSCYVSTSCLATEGEETQTGFGFSVGRELDDLDLEAAVADAARRATRLLGATKPESGRVTVVLDPYVSAQLLGIIGGTLSGSAVVKGRSPFADRVGEEVAASIVTLVDDPTDAAFYSASPTDGEGLASRRNVLLDAGVLQGFVHDTYSARRLGVAPTGSAVRGGYAGVPGAGCRALALTPGELDQPALLREVGEGVLISSVTGLHSGVNAVSGDFSTGASGLRIRDGELREPLREFTIASTLQRMLLDVEAVGGDVEWLPMSAAGVSLVIRDVTVSGS